LDSCRSPASPGCRCQVFAARVGPLFPTDSNTRAKPLVMRPCFEIRTAGGTYHLAV
jgi:hypothetical protein